MIATKARRAYAEKTKIPVDQSRSEIERLLKRYSAKDFAFFSEELRAVIIFHANGRRLRFDLPLPAEKGDREAQQRRQRWRALLLAIKAKLESVETGIETFEEAFLAHIVMPDGATVGQHTRPVIESAYKGEPLQPLLPAPKKSAV